MFDSADFTTFSKYTPANPDEKHARRTAISPLVGLWVESGLDPCLDWSSSWTRVTPTMRRRRANHWWRNSSFRSRRTENMAVVRIFSWYVTW